VVISQKEVLNLDVCGFPQSHDSKLNLSIVHATCSMLQLQQNFDSTNRIHMLSFAIFAKWAYHETLEIFIPAMCVYVG
jgi:hypothetical protein